MAANGVRQRSGADKVDVETPSPALGTAFGGKSSSFTKPAEHGQLKQFYLMFAFGAYFVLTCLTVHTWQVLGSPLYLINKDYYYAYMAVTKQFFGLLVNTITHLFSPTLIRISGDDSVAGQLHVQENGGLKCDFPHRLILVANHQIYTDWLYMWWVSYTARMHGHIYIILKESLKWIPVIGPAMQFYGFIFMARNWAKDKPRMQHRLRKLNSRHSGPMSGDKVLDPMWLLIFPEGTNLSDNGRNASKKFADKIGISDMQHQLLPRSTGLHFCIEQLQTTVHWVYDCTIAYEGVPRGEFGQDIYTLRALYFQGKAPRSVNMYWRRFAVSSIPLKDPADTEQWLRDRWREKDDLLEQYVSTGRFPPNHGADIKDGAVGATPKYFETEVQSDAPEFVLSFAPLVAFLTGLCLFLFWRLV